MRKAIWGASFGLALAISITGLFLTECSDNNLGSAQGDGGTSGCPTNPPTTGSACTLPNGTMCNQYPEPGCECCNGGGGYECDNGTWQELGVANGVAPAFVCPTTVPEAGTPCSSNPCGGADPACSYDCTSGNGKQQIASCPSGVWVVQDNPSAGECLADGGTDADVDASDGG